jgi:hypothetical protein
MLEIFFNYICYIFGNKKDYFLTKILLCNFYIMLVICFFYSPKYNEFSTETSHGYVDNVYVFPDLFWIVLKHKSRNSFFFFKNDTPVR